MKAIVTLAALISLSVLLVLVTSHPGATAGGFLASQPVAGSIAPPPGFETRDFSTARHPARLTEADAVHFIENAGWHINIATDVQAQYMGWTSNAYSYRTSTGMLQPYGYRDVWVVTATGGLDVPNPGVPRACRPHEKCPWVYDFHNLAFILDDKSGHLIVTRAF